MQTLFFPLIVGAVFLLTQDVIAQESFSRFETFDRYDPTQFAYEVEGVKGEFVDTRTLGVSWETEDFVVPGNGGLDIVISRSFNKLSHTPSDMGHWYFGVPRIQIPTSPWRGPYDPARADTPTFLAAWNNLNARLNYGATSICMGAGNLVDSTVTGSLSRQTKGGIFFAAPLVLYIPGEGAKLLLEKIPGLAQFPANAKYVTTDNWYARCLATSSTRHWGGFEVISPRGTHYIFDFIQYMVPGEYANLSTGGWLEMGISSVVDVHGNRLDYHYDLSSGGTALLDSIDASDGRQVSFEYYPGSVLGVDVQGSPLSVISAITIHADGQLHTIRYNYCDFTDVYITHVGCDPLELGTDKDLPVLQEVVYPDGTRWRYSYNPSLYSVNIQLDWGNFEFLLDEVRLPTGGQIHYTYQAGYSPVLQATNSPAPRLATRTTGGRDVAAAEWQYTYALADHIERTTVTGPDRQDSYEFYEGLGTYEFQIARYPGKHQWPGTSPTDYDEVMGELWHHSINRPDGSGPLRRTDYEYALLPFIGKQYYGTNWLGWPTLVLAQIRPMPLSRSDEWDFYTATTPLQYSTYTQADEFDVYGMPLVIHSDGHNVLSDDGSLAVRTELGWLNDTAEWLIGLPAHQQQGALRNDYEYFPGTGLLSQATEAGINTNYEYDDTGNLTVESWLRDGVVYRREFGDYHRGRAGYQRDPLDPATGGVQLTRNSIDDLGHLRWTEDAAGNRSSYQYDPMGHVISVQAPATQAMAISYQLNSQGELEQINQLQGTRLRRISLDGFGRVTLLRDGANGGFAGPSLRAKSWGYDALGRIEFVSQPFSWTNNAAPVGTRYQYDWFDRMVAELPTNGLGSRLFCYSWECNNGDYAQQVGPLVNGYVITDALGYQAGYEFAAVGKPATEQLSRLVAQVSPATEGARFRDTEFDRDEAGRLRSISQGDWSGTLLQRLFDYDGALLVAETQPETGLTVHGYDEQGNRIYTQIGSTEPLYRSYDGLNRLTGVDYPGSMDDIHYRYNDAGLLSQLRNGHTEWLYSYDPAGRMLSESLTVAGTRIEFGYSYDASGGLVSIVYPSGRVVDFAPDVFGRPTRAGEVVQSADYWPDGSLKALQYGNGVAASFTQNSQLLPAARHFAGPDGQLLAGFDYDYGQLGNVRAVSNLIFPERSSVLGYDGLSRLIQADGYWGSGTIAYDGVDNILHKWMGPQTLNYAYDAQSNLLQRIDVGTALTLNYAHDLRGNVRSNQFYDFAYNAGSQLTGVEQFPSLAYRYDGHGRRTVSETGDGQEISVYDHAGVLRYVDSCDKGGQVSEFVYLGTELVGRVDSDCTVGCHP